MIKENNFKRKMLLSSSSMHKKSFSFFGTDCLFFLLKFVKNGKFHFYPRHTDMGGEMKSFGISIYWDTSTISDFLEPKLLTPTDEQMINSDF